MAKIAVRARTAMQQVPEAGVRTPTYRPLASGDGWSVADAVCDAGPDDRPFEEQHVRVSVGVVLAGTFHYRSSIGDALMLPGSLLLGNAGDRFTCGHEHGSGDRCLAFSFAPALFERLAADVAAQGRRFGAPRLPPLRALSSLVAQAATLLMRPDPLAFEVLSLSIAGRALEIERGVARRRVRPDGSALSRVSRVVRTIEHEPEAPRDLQGLARIARLSPYHFIRCFESVTGTTPHQYLLRLRLRRAAVRLRTEQSRIADIAFDCGFGDLSNFNRTFRAEFGRAPRAFRDPGPVSPLTAPGR